LAPIGALGIKDAKSAKKMEKSGNSSYLVLPLKASVIELQTLLQTEVISLSVRLSLVGSNYRQS